MCANDRLRSRGRRSDFVDIKTGSIAGKNRARLANAIKLAENILFQRHAFKRRLDHHIDASEFAILQSRPNEFKTLVHKLLREASPLYRVRVIPLNVRKPAIKRRLIAFLEQHRNSGIGEHHGDAATHRPRSNDAHRVHRNNRRLLRYIGNLRHFALAEKRMNQRLRLIGEKALREEIFFLLTSFSERQLGGGFDGVDSGEWRKQPALLLASLLPGSSQDRSSLLSRA